MVRKTTVKTQKTAERKKSPGKKEEYSAKDIFVLRGLEPVRKRPAMYIGSTGPEGLHHLIFEAVDNGIDEAMMGFCNEITVTLLPDNKVKVSDNGRGIPVERHPQTKKSALETVMTMLHAGAKFQGKVYQVSGGLHGVGISVVCALSSWMKAEVCRKGLRYAQEYRRGRTTTKVRKVGKCKQSGTTVVFQPDPEIFKEIKFNFQNILSHLRQQAFLTAGVKIKVSDERGKEPQSFSFYFEGGVKSYIRYLTKRSVPFHPHLFYVAGDRNGIRVEGGFQYTKEYESFEESFANNIFTSQGGTHLTGFRTALTRTLNDYARKEGFLKEKEENLSSDDIREGLTGVISVKIKDPQFEGQTKTKLGNAEARLTVEQVISEGLGDFLERYSQDARAIIEKCIIVQKARRAAKAARETVLRKGVLEGLSLPGKLADCSSRKPEESELFLVEGDSAGGCFFGDTKIALVDGRNISFRELVREAKAGKRNYCYTIKEGGFIDIAPIKNPRKTKIQAKVIKVILDNGKEIICTPDHLFMLRDGSYKKAEDLTFRDSLMPLYRKYSKKGRINLDRYNEMRRMKNNKILICHKTICQRFFDGDKSEFGEAIRHFNHRVKKIVKLKQKMDVYDLEMRGTHNFALASGVFVHNSAKSGRDRRFQAILPLRGKILNVERARLDKLLANKEIKSLIIALGTAIAEDFNIEKAKYHRIIIMTDADIDGSHIRTLLLTLFYRYFKPLIEKGYLYIAKPPLYRIQKSKQIEYAYTDEDKTEILSEFQREKEEKIKGKKEKEVVVETQEKEKITGITVQRFKGLGEMNPPELWETTMAPQNRILLQVTIENAQEADKIFDTLMGSEVLPRKKFIQTHAKKVKNLDI